MSDEEFTGRLGWAHEHESVDKLNLRGVEPGLMLKAARENAPQINVQANPLDIFDIQNQGAQGACQGFALERMFSICYFLATGKKKRFSQACGYYLSQKHDGIRGDRGSTLSGGQYVATKHGMCEYEDWPYPSRYDNQQPSGIAFPFKLVSSQATSDPDVIMEALDMGLPVQDGIMWDRSVNRQLCDNYSGAGGGGHSTTLWCKKGSNYLRLNSWGPGWGYQGTNQNTPRALEQQIRHRFSTHVIYAPESMIFPDLKVIDHASF